MKSIQLGKMHSGCIFRLLEYGVKIQVLSKMTLFYIQDRLHFLLFFPDFLLSHYDIEDCTIKPMIVKECTYIINITIRSHPSSSFIDLITI